MVNIGSNASDYFQSDEQLRQAKLRELKRTNTLGQPLPLPSKILSLRPLVSSVLGSGSPHLLVTDAGNMCRVIDVKELKPVAVLKGHSGPVTTAIARDDPSAGDTFIYTASWDKTIRKWSLKTLSCLATWAIHTDFVKSLALTADGLTLFSGSSDRTIRRLDLATGQSTALMGHTRGVEDLLLCPETDMEGNDHPNRMVLWSCSSDGTIRRWNPDTGECLEVIRGHETSVYNLYMDENEQLWSASADMTVQRRTLSMVKGKSEWVAESSLVHPDFVKAVVTILGSTVVITGCRDSIIRVWNAESEKLFKSVEGHFDEVSALLVMGNTLYSGSLDGTIRQWPVRDLMDPAVQYKLDIDMEEKHVSQKGSAGLTAEEEDELNDLMAED